MTIITATTAANSSGSQTGSSTSSVQEIQDQFMTLLLAQLENQDPTDPMDTDTFTSQLCSISQLEQSCVTNDYLKNLDSSVNNSQAVSYIGKSVTVEGNTVDVSEDSTGNISLTLSDDAAEIYINLYDDNGNMAHSETLTDLSSGTYTISLDNLDESMAGCSYTFEVSAYDEDGNSVDTTTYSYEEVTGVVYEDGSAYLIAGDQKIAIDDVVEIYQS